ncbi:potassium transporter Kup [Aquamicrobium sp.]|uniref:potassium transporter Kup n=1 Tax=Aquamicrobium sp. TaxID=1872579 RepID=UPI0025907549|nr:potassium transporter Kup [Aquamicrobium sp.]MCK9553756.1 potassium transporter Kup [Aquamicrobium sp.]
MAVADPGSEVGSAAPADQPEHKPQSTPLMMLAALGVVYGDIGTSPIYAFRVALGAASGSEGAVRHDILGVLSLIIWVLTIVVAVKYMMFVLRADNKGEGGTLSLMALSRSAFPKRPALILGIGMLGAALFYGDAVITPAISVLSATEGLTIIGEGFAPYIVPLTVVILLILFSVQRFGSGGVATIFGPITLIWFLAIGFAGLRHIIHDPEILLAFNPLYMLRFIGQETTVSMAIIGGVFLAVTGAESVYADLGHFGRRPIVLAWFWVVFPCLLLNYLGQGAFVLSHDGAVGHPFFQMNDGWLLYVMVALATAATVIASQAVITGAYSLTRQAVQLNMLPRMEIRHTSETQSGQIYMPRVNFLMAVVVLLLVLGFRESEGLASAYGIAVTGVMLVTTTLFGIIMIRIWKWPLWAALSLTALFGLIELGFLVTNAMKVRDGGWASLVVAFMVIVVMVTWVRGSRLLFEKTRKNEIPLEFLAGNLEKKQPQLVPGTAIFLTSDPFSAPTALMHSLKHYKVLHERNIILSVVTAPQPKVPDSERVKLETINDLFMRITLTFGYMEQPNIPRALATCRKQGWKFDIMTTSFFLSRRSLKASASSGMPMWQDRLFISLARTAADATEYFQIPTGRVVEIGTQVAI